MFLKYSIFLIFNFFILLTNGNNTSCEVEDLYLHLFGQVENLKRSLDIMNSRINMLYDKAASNAKPIFDIRYDNMPPHCPLNPLAISCAEAAECIRTSGIYNITSIHYSKRTFTVFCDHYNYEGDWMYILVRKDGTENFNRPWNDYVQGFGNVAGEYWLGLDNLYAMTNFYGPQELNVHMENFDGIKRYARYDNFVIGNATENYKIKSLGLYSGTAGDSLSYHMGMQFSTYDSDNDEDKNNCAETRKGGFWYKSCAEANPTGSYLRGSNPGKHNNLKWKSFKGDFYSLRHIVFMIRRQSAAKLD